MLQERLEEISLRESSLFSGMSCRKEFRKEQMRFLSYFPVHFYSIISLFVLRLIIHIAAIYSDVSMDVIIIARFVSKTEIISVWDYSCTTESVHLYPCLL